MSSERKPIILTILFLVGIGVGLALFFIFFQDRFKAPEEPDEPDVPVADDLVPGSGRVDGNCVVGYYSNHYDIQQNPNAGSITRTGARQVFDEATENILSGDKEFRDFTQTPIAADGSNLQDVDFLIIPDSNLGHEPAPTGCGIKSCLPEVPLIENIKQNFYTNMNIVLLADNGRDFNTNSGDYAAGTVAPIANYIFNGTTSDRNLTGSEELVYYYTDQNTFGWLPQTQSFLNRSSESYPIYLNPHDITFVGLSSPGIVKVNPTTTSNMVCYFRTQTYEPFVGTQNGDVSRPRLGTGNPTCTLTHVAPSTSTLGTNGFLVLDSNFGMAVRTHDNLRKMMQFADDCANPAEQTIELTVEGICQGNESSFTATWEENTLSGATGYVIEITDQNDWDNGHWSKTISDVSTLSTFGPDGFDGQNGYEDLGDFTLIPDEVYNLRVRFTSSSGDGITSQTVSFTASDCSEEETKTCYSCNQETSTCDVEEVSLDILCDGTDGYYTEQTACTDDCTPAEVTDPTIEKEGNIISVDSETATVNYTLTVTNPNEIEQTFDVTDVLPEGTQNALNISAGGAYSSTNRTITWNNVTVAANSSVNLTYTIIVPSSAYGDLSNTATIFDETGATQLDQVTETMTLTYANLSVNKTGQLLSVDNTQAQIEYIVQVSNPNNFEVSNVEVRDTLPVGTTAATSLNPSGTVDLGARTITWSNQTFAALESRTYSFVATLAATGYAPQGPAVVSNVVVVTADDNLQDDYTETTNVDASAETSVSKSSSTNFSANSVAITYTITARNLSEVNLSSYSVVDDFDTDVTASMISDVTPATGVVSGGTITWDNVNIAAGGTQTFTYTVTMQRTNVGTYTNNVILYNESNSPAANDSNTVTIPEITITAEPEPEPEPTPQQPQAPSEPLPETSVAGNAHVYLIFAALFITAGISAYKVGLFSSVLDEKVVFTMFNSLFPYNQRVENIVERKAKKKDSDED